MIKLYLVIFGVSLSATMFGCAVVVLNPAVVSEQHIIALIGGALVSFGNFIAICMEVTTV
jgi:glucose uptake protein GlcU